MVTKLFLKIKTFLKTFFFFLKEWSNMITAIAMVISVFYVVYSTKKNLTLVSKTIEQTNEQLMLQQKSIPSHFEMSFKNVNTFKEQAFITNTGKTVLLNLNVDLDFYFINHNDEVLTGKNLPYKLMSDSVSFKLVSQAGLIKYPLDINGFLGTSRSFYLSILQPKNETLVEISPSSLQNALKLARVLDRQVFIAWRIKYNEELSNQEVTSMQYTWLNDINHSSKILQNNYEPRINIKDFIGGKYVIDLIENFRNNYKEEIFGH